MREFLIDIGKTLFYLGIAKTKSGQLPQEVQYYGIGLYFFTFGCVCLGLLVIVSSIYLIK